VQVKVIKLCPRKYIFALVTLTLTGITLKLETDLDILNVYLHAGNQVDRLRHSKLLTVHT